MSADRAALVAAIGGHPDDDTPRLACADWFEEQGGAANVARAAFIRAQVERARLPQSDPRQSELEARELRLLRAHFSTWAGSHFAFKKSRFRRGFIEYVHLHLKHFLHHRRQLLALEPVRDVSLTGWMRADASLAARVAGCEELRRIETLRVHHLGPHKSPCGEVATLLESPHLTGLKGLHLPLLAVTADERRRIERAPALAVRDLTLPPLDNYPHRPGAWLSDGPPASGWANVRAQRLSDDGTRGELIERLAALPCWGRLDRLDVRLGWSSADDIAALVRHLPGSLRALTVTGDGSGSGAVALPAVCARAGELPLTELRMSGVALGAGEVESLLQSGALRRLALAGDLDAGALRALAASPAVRGRGGELELSAADPLPPNAARALFAPANVRNLTRLALGGYVLDDAGAAELAAADPPALRAFALCGCRLSGRGLRALLCSPACRNLVTLHYGGVGWNQTDPFDAACAAAVAELPYIASARIDADESSGALAEVAWAGGGPGIDPNACAPVDGELREADQDG